MHKLHTKVKGATSVKIGDKTFELDDKGRFKTSDFPDALSRFGKPYFTPSMQEANRARLAEFQDDKIPSSTDPKFFEAITQAVVNLYSGKKTKFRDPDTKQLGALKPDNARMIGLDPNFMKKWLYVAEIAGLMDEPTDIVEVRPSIPLTEDEAEFRKKKKVEKWLKEYPSDAQSTMPLHTLYKALKIMGKNEDEILYANHEDPLGAVKDIVKEKLKSWAFDKDAVDPFDKGKGRSTKMKTGAGTFYFFIKYLRHYLVANGLGIPKQSRTSVLSQRVVGHGQYKELKAESYQIEQMKDCLKQGYEKGIPKTVTTIDKDGHESQWHPTKEDWYDAYFYFSLGMQIGFRAEEAFTIPVYLHPIEYSVENQGVYEAGKVGTSYNPKDALTTIHLFTRKTKHVSIPTHAGVIFDKEVNDMIKARMKQVEDSKRTNSKATLDSLGIVKHYNRRVSKIITTESDETKKKIELKSETNTIHSLIGRDGKYAAVGTLHQEFASTSGKYATNRKHLRDIMRHCYTHIADPLPEEYFGLMPLHSIRHLFAQYWLEESEWDYGFVARLGHWKTIAELENSYGYMTDKIFNKKWSQIHKEAYSKTLIKKGDGAKEVRDALNEVVVAKGKTSLSTQLDSAYENTAEIIAEKKEELNEDGANDDEPLTEEQADELEIAIDNFKNNPVDIVENEK